jgi:hypothetical protein
VGSPTGRESYGDGGPVVVAGVTPAKESGRAGSSAKGARWLDTTTREVGVMPSAERYWMSDVGTAAEVNLPPTYSRSSHWRARCREIWHGGFGPGAAGKEPDKAPRQRPTGTMLTQYRQQGKPPCSS